MAFESFRFRLQIMGEDNLPNTLPDQVTKKALIAYIRRRWQDPYVQREMVKYFSKFPSNTLNQMVSKLDQIAVEFERKRNEQQGS